MHGQCNGDGELASSTAKTGHGTGYQRIAERTGKPKAAEILREFRFNV
jgi:hypothetical protein